jgi:hypothetical protein
MQQSHATRLSITGRVVGQAKRFVQEVASVRRVRQGAVALGWPRRARGECGDELILFDRLQRGSSPPRPPYAAVGFGGMAWLSGLRAGVFCYPLSHLTSIAIHTEILNHQDDTAQFE